MTRRQQYRAGARRGFTLLELMIVVVIIGLLASIAVPAFGDIQRMAVDNVVLTDLQKVKYAIEEYRVENMALPDEDDLEDAGLVLSPGVSFDKFDVKDEDDPEKARVHIHIEHASSPHYYHIEYPGLEEPEQRWKK